MLIKFAADNNWEMLPTLMQKKIKERKRIIKRKIDWVDICSELYKKTRKK